MRVAILGGGLQGCCTAIALALRGAQVTLYDRNSTLMAAAATANEGKIHLGYVYAADRSLATARTMLRGALSFAPLLKMYLETDGALAVSAPFVYAVHRDSQLAAEDIAAHLHATHALVATTPGPNSYFGVDLGVPPRRLTPGELERQFETSHVRAAFTTPEIAVNVFAIADALRRRITQDSRIDVRTGRVVTAVEDEGARLSVRTVDVESADADEDTFDRVVNALWDGRLAIDVARGMHPGRKWIHRFKHGIGFRLAEPVPLPSVTIVLGPFGDLVAYGDGLFYVSWYPACMTARSDALAPPPWREEPDEPLRTRIVAESFDALGTILPALRTARPLDVRVRAGIIVAWGETDIDDRASELHLRYEIGVHSRGGYHSIDTGKMTMAPYFAHVCADRILPRRAP